MNIKTHLLSALLLSTLGLTSVASAAIKTIQGIVVDADSRLNLKDVDVGLVKNGEVIEKTTINSPNSFFFQHDFNDADDYTLTIKKENYEAHTIDLTSALKSGKMPQLMTLSLGGEKNAFIFKGLIKNRSTHETLGNAKVTVTNTMTGETSHTFSNLQGEYSVDIKAGYEYAFKVNSGEFLKRFAKINYCADKLKTNNKYCFSGFTEVSLNPNGGISGASLMMDPVEIGKKFKVDNIYYDYNKATLRENAIPNLRKLLYVLKDNKHISIELGSHADSRGSDGYNLKLSQKRAESAVVYLLENGINAERVVAKGYGETVLTNNCANGVKCSASQHEENRRTEFIIIDIDKDKILD